MLVEELNVAIVDTLRDLLTDLMRRPALDHVQSCPSVLRLSAGRCANEKVVLELTLEAVLLDMVGKGSWDLPVLCVRIAIPLLECTAARDCLIGIS
jgi:hypothetical protein